jgi:CheY-like chemotaxis protein
VRSSHRAHRILLAEDNGVNQKVALGLLRQLRQSADVVTTGTAALEAVQAARYDMVLMDCQMPELDGYETTKRIRELEKNCAGGERKRPIYIVAVTAHAMKGDREKCLAAGMDDYLSKPLHLKTLADALERFQNGASTADAENLDNQSSCELDELPVVDTERLLEAVGGSIEEARDLADFFLEQAKEALELLERAVGNSCLREIDHLAHKLAGASASCGMSALIGPLREMECDARAGQLTQARAQVLHRQLTDGYERIESLVKSFFEKHSCPGELETALDGPPAQLGGGEN